MKRKWLSLLVAVMLLGSNMAMSESLDAFGQGSISVPDANALFAGATVTQDHIKVEGLPTGTADFYKGVTDSQIAAYRDALLSLGFEKANAVNGSGWQAQVYQCGEARVAVVDYQGVSPKRVVLIYEDGFVFETVAAADTTSTSALDSFVGNYIKINVDGKSLTMTDGSAEILKATGGYLTGRSTYNKPGLEEGNKVPNDSVYMCFGDGMDQVVIVFPVQATNGSDISFQTGKWNFVLYLCNSMLNDSDCGSFYSSYHPYTTLPNTYTIHISEIDSPITHCSGTFEGDLSRFGTIKHVSGEFNVEIK